MIIYQRQLFGLDLLLRLHGSAAARALVPAITSTVLMIICYYAFDLDLSQSKSWKVNSDPYPLAALTAAFTFLLAFRATFSYNRVSAALSSIASDTVAVIVALISLVSFSFYACVFSHLHPALGSCDSRSSNAKSMAWCGDCTWCIPPAIEPIQQPKTAIVRWASRAEVGPSWTRTHNKNDIDRITRKTTSRRRQN